MQRIILDLNHKTKQATVPNPDVKSRDIKFWSCVFSAEQHLVCIQPVK